MPSISMGRTSYAIPSSLAARSISNAGNQNKPMHSTRIQFIATLTCGVGLIIPAMANPALTGATLFRGDASGNNLNGQGGVVYFGAWTTVLDQQNIPGNYGGEFFLAQTPTPGPSNFLTPASAFSASLNPGANTFYFWADGDDTRGGSATFGLNLFFNNAGPVSPAISGYTIPGTGQTLNADSSPQTAGYNFVYTPGAGALSFTLGGQTVTLSSFVVDGVGGAAAGPGSVDLVNSINTMPFTPPPHPDGITDTYGSFTLTVIPEPSALGLFAVAALAFTVAGPKRLSRQ